MIRRYACGYVDNDSLLDYFEVVLIASPNIYDYDDSAAVGLMYLSSNDYAPSDSILLYETPPFNYDGDYDNYNIRYITELFCRDADGDDQPEIYFTLSMFHSYFWFNMWYTYETYYLNFRYIPGDQS
ncbi:MAG: hypothetical protein AB1746_14730, partial [Candidatus Zixiibacteriota bacterium]